MRVTSGVHPRAVPVVVNATVIVNATVTVKESVIVNATVTVRMKEIPFQ